MTGGNEMDLVWAIVLWGLATIAVLVGIQQIVSRRRPPEVLPTLPPARAQELDERYARGEISRAEYERLLEEMDER